MYLSLPVQSTLNKHQKVLVPLGRYRRGVDKRYIAVRSFLVLFFSLRSPPVFRTSPSFLPSLPSKQNCLSPPSPRAFSWFNPYDTTHLHPLAISIIANTPVVADLNNPARHIVVYASRLRFSHCLTSRTDVTGETATRATTHVRPLRTISQCPVPRERHRRSTTRSSRPILSTRSWMALSSCISVRTPWHGPLRLRLCSSRTDSSQTGTWSTK